MRRSGGIAGVARAWSIDTDSCDDPDAWYDLVATLPRDAPAHRRPGPPDDFSWTITVARTTVSMPGTQLDGPWRELVTRVRDQGEPS